jgi:tetratricopeptide (TPR) repeat protein
VDPVTAATRAFGELKQLHSALDSYIQQDSFDTFKMTMRTEVDDSSFEVQGITPVEAEAVKADFLACSGRIADARALLNHVLQEDPANRSARETMGDLESLESAQTESGLRAAIQGDPAAAAARDQLAVFLWTHHRNLDEARTMELKAVSLDPANFLYQTNLAKILLALGRAEGALEALRHAETLARTPPEIHEVDQLLASANQYADIQERQRLESTKSRKIASGGTAGDSLAAHLTQRDAPEANGSHHFIVGVLKDVHCESPAIDLTVHSRGKILALHAENYYRIEFSALNFSPPADLKPCEDLEGRPAKVEYVESEDESVFAQVLAVELHK